MDPIVTPACIDVWSKFLVQADVVLGPFERRVIEQLPTLDYIDFLERTIAHLTRHSRDITSSSWRIYCLTPDPSSILMWAHYGACHTGICLEFDATCPVISEAREVAYRRERPLINAQMLSNPSELTETMLLTKSDDWAYEREYRVLCRNGDVDTAPTKNLRKTVGDFLELPPNAITRVIVGCRGDLDRVAKVVHDCRPDLKVQQVVQSAREYQLNIPQ